MTLYKLALALLLTFPAHAQFSNATRLQGRKIDPVAPTDTQALVWDAASSSWKPGSGGGGGGGITGITGTAGGNATGPTVTFALSFACSSSSITRSSNTLTFCFPPFATKAFLPVRTNATTLTTNSNCGAAPNTCQARFGNTAYQYAASPRAILGSGAGTAFGYVAAGGAWTVGHNVTMSSCDAGLTCTGGVTAFPVDSIPKWKWTISGGNWDASGFEDWRDDGSTKIVACAGGLTQIDSAGTTTCAVDTTAVAQKFFGTAAPGSVSGNLPGDFFTDTTAHNQYVCNAPSGTAAPACTSVTAAGWLLVNGGAGGGGSVFTGSTASTSSFSATPTFSLADVSVKSPVRFEPGALTANVTAVTFSNKSAGAKFSIAWLQDGTGGRTVACGASASNCCTIDPTASITTVQFFEVAADGTTVNGTGCTTTSGISKIPAIQSSGTTFGISGCSNSSPLGGNTSGSFLSGTTGTCTVTITMGDSATSRDWHCTANNRTNPANIMVQSGAASTTQATITGTTTSGDLISLSCAGLK